MNQDSLNISRFFYLFAVQGQIRGQRMYGMVENRPIK